MRSMNGMCRRRNFFRTASIILTKKREGSEFSKENETDRKNDGGSGLSEPPPEKIKLFTSAKDELFLNSEKGAGHREKVVLSYETVMRM